MGINDSDLEITQNEADGGTNAKTGLLRGHWRTVAVLLNIYDIAAVNLAYFLALWLRFDLKFSLIRPDFLDAWMRFAPIYTVFCIAVFWAFRLYRSLWKFASYSELMHLIAATGVTLPVLYFAEQSDEIGQERGEGHADRRGKRGTEPYS